MHELMYRVSRGTATRETEIQIKMLMRSERTLKEVGGEGG